MEAKFAALFTALYVAHMIGDYWVQTDWQARTKAQPGMIGRTACALHVTTYTMTLAAVVALVAYRLDVDLSAGRVAVGLGVSAITHYFADRRTPLHRLAVLFRYGAAWLESGGLSQLDQAWHIGWLLAVALIIV